MSTHPETQEPITQEDLVDWYLETAAPIEKATGAKLCGFEPNFSFRWEHNMIDLPTSFVIRLSKILKERENNEGKNMS